MSVSPTSKTLNIGETVQLTGTKNPTSASEGTQWTSSNTGVATVSGSGLVTAKASGTATITFKNSSSTKSASCKITVLKGNVILGGSGGYKKLREYDSNGNLVWEKTSTDKNRYNSTTVDFTITTLVATPDGGCILGGSGGYEKLRKYDSNGNLVWEKTSTDKNRYNSTTVDFTITTLVATPDGGCILGGSGGHEKLRKYDNNGNLVLEKTSTDKNRYNSTTVDFTITTLVATPDGGCILGGSGGLEKLRKYDSNGNLVWEKTSTDKNRYNSTTVDFTITTLSVFK